MMSKHSNQHTILVSGATGQVGGAVAHRLLEKNYHVRALTRDRKQDAARMLSDRGAEVVEGDFDDHASIDAALASVHGAFSIQNWQIAGMDRALEQSKAFADAALEAGVAHFVYLSSAGAALKSGVSHIENNWKVEEHIRRIGLPATMARPVFFMENWFRYKDAVLGGQLPQPLSPDRMLQQVAVADIGAIATLIFDDPDKWKGRAIEIVGDELTMKETAETFGRVLGRDVEYRQMDWETFEQQAGKEIATMYRWYEKAGYEADIEVLRKVYPQLTNLTQFLRAQNRTSSCWPSTIG